MIEAMYGVNVRGRRGGGEEEVRREEGGREGGVEGGDQGKERGPEGGREIGRASCWERV